VEESHAAAAGPTPGSFADGRQSRRLAALQSGFHVCYLQSDVVQAGPAPLQEAPYGRVGGGGLEELQPGVTEVEEGDLYLFRVDDLATRVGPAQNSAVDGHRRVEILHGDCHVLETSL
jgi:hypothetical protein